ncbi:DUF4249 family protein [Natronoflexus pectinivorans]|uniref:Uncharacterized protein DUF4249 n=1 Tax=Natronoflexus pectinivorans TaxID=682526 RepID=A0A4R2GJ12_9BACT|nr:DUF4249 family protein [Natronoflexus pectinivorans]TCO08701.1 uncharacterized protein DUF4249 [Natronoflexus pectinivorans]
MNHPFKYIVYIIFLLLFVVFVSSCEDTVTDFKIKSQPSKIVLNGLLEPDSIIKVHLHKSAGIDELLLNTAIENAEVELFENSIYIGTLNHTGYGYYAMDNVYPKAGSTYRIEAHVDKIGMAWGETTIPKTPELNEIVTTYRYNVPERGCSGCGLTNRFNMEIKTEVEPGELYFLAISAMGYRYLIEYGTPECEELYNSEYDYYYNDCVFPEADTLGLFPQMIEIATNDKRNTFLKSSWNSGMKSYWLSYFDYEELGLKQYFSNEHFRNEALTINIDIVSSRLYNNEGSKFDLLVYRYDENYYKFLLSLARRNEAEDFLFTEKVSIYSNVENGLGVLGSASGTVVTVEYDVEKFTQTSLYDVIDLD